jgi:hypothetical protein
MKYRNFTNMNILRKHSIDYFGLYQYESYGEGSDRKRIITIQLAIPVEFNPFEPGSNSGAGYFA